MRDIVFVKPLSGLIVRDPNNFSPLPENGMNVPLVGIDGKYWRRRIQDGSVIVVSDIKKETPKKSYSGKAEMTYNKNNKGGDE